MCGIYFTTKIFNDEIIVRKLDRIKFRGPDFSNFINVDNKAILGHNRLAIIDLDARSNQPFKYLHLWIVFNGEIYNFLDLRTKLTAKGFTFSTDSDTEVICAAYLAYGENCVTHFNGMFSFVIYDQENQRVFGAKDRLGKKPLFYRVHNSTLECASQPNEILIGNDLEISDKSLESFLTYSYIPSPESVYKDVFKLSGGYYFTYTLGNNDIKLTKYWDLNYADSLSFSHSYNDALEHLESLLTNAVKIRMLSDVPLGAFLSGGIDSSLISAIANRVSSTQLKTFSVKFNEGRFDESVHAASTAKYLGTNHTTIECNYEDGIDLIQKLPEFYDEPFGDSSAIPSMLLSKSAKKYVTVALSGDGGDEGFLGYNHFDIINKASSLYRVPYLIRFLAGNVLNISNSYKAQIISAFLQYPDMNMFIQKIFETFQPIFNYPVSTNHKDVGAIKKLKYNDLQKAADINIKLWLENDSNVKVDRASMSASLEVRSPLLDYRIIEFARTLPVDFRYQKGNKKRILKDLTYKFIPKEMLDRPKTGFTMPFEEWFRDKLKPFVYDTITEENLKLIPLDLNTKYILNSIDLHMQRKKNFYPTIWNLIVLITWLKYQAAPNYHAQEKGLFYS
ncbi:asparagine synthase (glutamine-hydrolyzing) [Mucilaginibacter agri]|uniref:asparagine synthase (glutamine-hydrolyzing) n=1 Tax=Mucilaginibacter agri TaxID=2695265 RepID=A0A966DVH7_9SPHI|nr:asparagine synthase (glutamine-hydrolyzing) [Mucilaginibacter agri]NCD70554.1 asparagine synthase (glutamine-hydrolyzing) [Mucilaginibacter agri]